MTHIRWLVDVLARRVHALLYFEPRLEIHVFDGRMSVYRNAPSDMERFTSILTSRFRIDL